MAVDLCPLVLDIPGSSAEKLCWDSLSKRTEDLEQLLSLCLDEAIVAEHDRPSIADDARSQISEHRDLLRWHLLHGNATDIRQLHVRASAAGFTIETRELFDIGTTETNNCSAASSPVEEYAVRVCSELGVPEHALRLLACELAFELRRAAVDSLRHGGLRHPPRDSDSFGCPVDSKGDHWSARLVRQPGTNDEQT